MPITECANGHVYDSDQYAACPYCNSGRTVINFVQNEEGKTVAPNGYSGNGHTVMPDNASKVIRPIDNTEEIGQTVSPDEWKKRNNEVNKTVGIFKKKYDFDPVAGWLVCVEGPEKGNDFRLAARINSIGRDESMDVCLKGDAMVSRNNHASIGYDPRHNVFTLVPGMSVNNIYLNDEPVYVPTKLQPYDKIEIGEHVLLFVPFCGENFSWPMESSKKE